MKIGSSFIFHRDVIGPAEAPYMIRYKLIDTPWFAIRIHRILKSDSDRHLHDHPWHFVSFVLSGGYREETPGGERVIQAPAIVAHRATDLHRLTLDRPATTLVFCGPRFREWGFQVGTAWVQWREYLQVEADMQLLHALLSDKWRGGGES